jgi:hypothetical protein
MSSLIFKIEDYQVSVATDTLAVESEFARPSHFTTKTLILPHLRLIVAGTGTAGFMDRWFTHINTGLIARDVDGLNHFTPTNLIEHWAAWNKEFPSSNANTTTIYHFGFSERTGHIHSYAYRSEDGFVPHARGTGTYAKPDCALLTGPRFSRDVVRMMKEQRTIQASAQGKRVHIGGEVWLHRLNRNGFKVTSLGRFADFDETEKTIYKPFQ